jgi:serine/threonine protein kinase
MPPTRHAAPSYFAPEQLEGSKANEQTDIFSYGDVYYELLTGAHPFERHKNDWRALQIAILSYEPKPLGELLPGCPEALETLVHRTLAKHTERRTISTANPSSSTSSMKAPSPSCTRCSMRTVKAVYINIVLSNITVA